MKFKMIHENYNVSDLDRSIKFYNEALDLHEVRRKTTGIPPKEFQQSLLTINTPNWWDE